MVDAVQAKEIDTKPYLTFEFKYRPLSLLIANDIAPKILHTLSTSPDAPDLPSDTEVKNVRMTPSREVG